MIELATKENIERKVKKLRTLYNPKSIKDLEVIAKQEYRVRLVIEAPSAYGLVSGVTFQLGGYLFILYYAPFKPYRPFVLGHEIGHIALGTLRTPDDSEHSRVENEADYFSARLNNSSLIKYKAYQMLNRELSLFLSANKAKLREDEAFRKIRDELTKRA